MIYEAIQALLPSNIKSFLWSSELSNPPALSDYPHVVIWGTIPTEHSGSGVDSPTLADELDALIAEVRFTYAATSGQSLNWLLERARPAINRQAPTIPGYHVELLKPRSLQPMTVDRDISIEGRNPVFATDEATLRASKL